VMLLSLLNCEKALEMIESSIGHKLNTSKTYIIFMGFQPRIKSRRDVNHEYTKPLREKGKNRKDRIRRVSKSTQGQNRIITAKAVSEETLKRLSTLGSQKFGSSPFSEYFDCWLTDVKAVLSEFESNPNISVDEQFMREHSQILAIVERQLERRRRREASLSEEERSLLECKNLLVQIKAEYVAKSREISRRKNREIKQLYRSIDHLKRDQDEVIRMKTGFFRGVSRKDREQREIDIAQRLTEQQRTLELATLNFKAAQEELRDEYERKNAPVLNQMKNFQKKLQEAETDASLEDRWFACDALIDAVNNFLQRKSASDEAIR
jgi:hypothetical protein